MVGLSVVRGRLPPWTTLGWPSSRTKACILFPIGTPVVSAMNRPPKNHAEDGEAEKRLPSASATSIVVVSGDMLVFSAAGLAATDTREDRVGGLPSVRGSNGHGSPGRATRLAREWS